MARFLITGTAGFIGFHLARRLLTAGHFVGGIDGFTPYYDVRLKHERHRELTALAAFRPFELMLEDFTQLAKTAREYLPDIIVHLAAQAGVRYSLENPRAYMDSNVTGTFNILEIAREIKPQHFLFASSSSVYGGNTAMPFRESDRADHALTLYAASKKAGEDLAHAYAHLYKIPTTALRFFTVYGPWGRPDMALFKFVDAAMKGIPIDVFGEGHMKRDFTYVDDLIEAVVRLVDLSPREGQPIGPSDSLSPVAPYRVVNIGAGRLVGLLEFIDAIEASIGRPVYRRMVPMQQGDVRTTWASTDLLSALTGYVPSTGLRVGVDAFVEWQRKWVRLKNLT